MTLLGGAIILGLTLTPVWMLLWRRRLLRAEMKEFDTFGFVRKGGALHRRVLAHIKAGNDCPVCTGRGLRDIGVPHDGDCPFVKMELITVVSA